MKDCIVLQARIRSTRLPGKLLLPLAGTSVFEHILMRIARARLPDGVIVATTPSTEPFIRETAERHGAAVIVGSEEDVLGRFVQAVRAYGLRHVVRATADNPLVSVEYIDRTLALHRETGSDLTAYPELPYGTGVEAVKGEALETASAESGDPFEREHITQYIYRHEGKFRITRGVPDAAFRRLDVRLTVDTEEDYRRMADIYDHLYKGEPVSLADALAFCDRRDGSAAEGCEAGDRPEAGDSREAGDRPEAADRSLLHRVGRFLRHGAPQEVPLHNNGESRCFRRGSVQGAGG
jgi:spore coat polysaccharide biosynthesis protein SpsF